MRLACGYSLLSIYLAPVAVGAVLTGLLEPLHRAANALTNEAPEQATESEPVEVEELLIPTTVLHEAFRMLVEHGNLGKEWVVALGYQKIEGRNIITHVYNLRCPVSETVEAEPDYGDLARALKFYESCGAQIAGLAHIHPWNARSVAPSAVDIATHSRWEELYDGRFIGIVFTNSGVFRIFHGKECRFRPVIVGNGVRRMGRNLYELEGTALS